MKLHLEGDQLPYMVACNCEQLKLVNQACDQIEEILDELVQTTACSNHAIRDLLSRMSEDWSDPHQLKAC